MPNVAELILRGRNEISPAVKAAATDLQRLASLAQQLGSGAGAQAGGVSRLGGAIQQTGQAATGATSALNRTVREQQQLANLTIRTAQLQGDYAAALRIVERELNNAAAGSIRYQSLLNKQITLTNQAQRAAEGGLGPALPRTLDGLSGSAAAAAQAFGLLGGAAGVGAVVLSAGQAANSLERTEATVRALSGSTERYAEVLALAKQGQQTYGGTLEENLRGLGGLVNLSNRAGVSLSDLDNIARRLAVVDPLQGFEGAQQALREFLNGSGAEAGMSLRDRFEIPKEALAALTAEGVTAQERLAGLNDALNQLGITNEVLANQTDTNAQAFTNLNAAFSNFTTAAGSVITEATAPLAQSLADLLNVLQKTPQGYIDAAAGAAYLQAILQGNVIGAEAAAQAARDQATAIFGQAAAEQAAADAAAAHGTAQAGAAAATGASTQATLLSASAIQQEARESLINTANTEALSEAKARLDLSVRTATMAMVANGTATDANVAALARVLGVAPDVIRAYLGIAQAAREASAAQSKGMGGGLDESRRLQEAGRGAEQAAAAAARVAAAQQAQVTATGTLAQRIAQEEAALRKLIPGTAAYINQQTKLVQLKQQAATASGRAGGAASNEAERLKNAQRALMNDQQLLSSLQAEYNGIRNKGSVRALELEKQIRDVQARMAANAAQAADARARTAEQAARQAQQEAAALEASRDALRSDEEKLANRRARLAQATTETERNTLTREILDLEQRITQERQRQVDAAKAAQRAAIDAAQARIDDERKRREEDTELARAQRVLSSGNSTAAQRRAAELRIEEILLDRKERELEIQEKLEAAAGATADAAKTAADANGKITGGPAKVPMLNTGDTLPVAQPAPVAAPMVAAPATTPIPVTVEAPSSGDGLAEALRSALNGATLMLQGSDGRLTPAVLSIAVGRVQVGKRG